MWRNCETNREPDHLVLTHFTFDDKPSGAIATITMRNTSEISTDTHPKECNAIRNDSYIDDIFSSRNKIPEVVAITKVTDNVLKK